jgi:hypothetical protein
MMALRGYPLGAVQFLEEAIKEINPIPSEVAEFLKEDDDLMIEVFHRYVRLFGLYQHPPFDPVVEGWLAQSNSPEVDQITTFYTDGLGGQMMVSGILDEESSHHGDEPAGETDLPPANPPMSCAVKDED